ncbi:GMC oxidoreductase [Actinomadura yumaensis]|uniref:Cholesterol oxidase n=1 Tax=Actinomadura yumaensis TaxID=111807 RepID=A0ABW2CSS4_9ACTN
MTQLTLALHVSAQPVEEAVTPGHGPGRNRVRDQGTGQGDGVGRREFLGLSAGGALAALTAAKAESLGRRARASAGTRTDFPAIVIGSGFGGSVAALRLGRAGVETLVVERGREWPIPNDTELVIGNQDRPNSDMFWMRHITDWPAVVPTLISPVPGVMELSSEAHLNIACGAAVGGGSIVYTGVTVPPPRRYFERLYPGLSWDEFATVWFPKVRATLNASPMPPDVYGSAPFTHSRVWDAHMRKAGHAPAPLDSTFDWGVVRRELAGSVRPSAIAGETDFACSDGAKRSLTRNYLPSALATGKVSLRPLTEVTGLGRTASGRYTVEVRRLAADGSAHGAESLLCDRLFVCAGTLNTNRLLVAARETGALPDLPAEIGTGFGDNGDQFNLYAYTDLPAGPSQGSPCASGTFHDSEFGIPMRAESWQLLGAHGLPVIHTLTMTADFDNRGTFAYDRLRGRVRLADWTRDKSRPSADAGAALNAKVIAANPGVVPFSLTWPFTLTAHPLGGVVLGRSTDLYGRVKGPRGLYVLDGSLIPGTVGGANPSLSIAALAERAMAAVVRDGG